MDDWEQELERLGGAVRPTGAVAGVVAAGLRRRQRRRRRGAVGAAAVATAVVLSGIAVASGPDRQPPAAAPAPVPSTTASEPTTAPLSCPTYDEVERVAPPIADLDEQRAAIASAREAGDGFTVTRAKPSPVGVLALVDGDLERARTVLGDLGIEHVWQDFGFGPMLQWVTRPVLSAVRRETRGIPGLAGLAYWDDGGGIIVSWKGPLPPEVAALAGTRGRVTVLVEETPYSAADLRRAQSLLQDFLVDSGLRDRWSSSSSCQGYTGLVVGMLPEVAGREGLAEQITEAVGVPVRVVAEERPVERLLPR